MNERERTGPAEAGDRHDGCGPWNPGIQSELPSRLLPLSTIFRPENSFTTVPEATELRDLTGLPLEDVAIFRPERLVVHELLIRVTATISVPDPEAARIDELGINFRRIAETIFAGSIRPRLPEIGARYASLKQTLAAAIDAELGALLAPRAPRPQPQDPGRTLFGFLRRPAKVQKTPAPSRESWEGEERRFQDWEAAVGASGNPARRAAGRALARVIAAVRAKHGRLWGDRAVLAQLAVGLACNDYCSRALGQLIEPYIAEACMREGYGVLSPQERPVIMNVKGASASGKSTMRPLQRRLAAELGVRWSDFALVSPDIWRKYLLDYASLGADYKYAGALTGRELAIVDQKLDRLMAHQAGAGGIPHLLIDRFRFDSFATDSHEAGSNLLTRFGHSIYMFFMITPPHETVERAWKRGLEVGRFKAVDDLLAHNVEAYSGMPTVFFTWALHPAKTVHYEFLDNDVPPGARPRTAAFGWYGEMNILEVKAMLAVDRYRKINVAATSPEQVYGRKEVMTASANTDFLTRCVRQISAVNFADQDSGRIYARFEAGRLAWIDRETLERALEDEETRAGLLALAPDLSRGSTRPGPPHVVRTDLSHTLGQWGRALGS